MILWELRFFLFDMNYIQFIYVIYIYIIKTPPTVNNVTVRCKKAIHDGVVALENTTNHLSCLFNHMNNSINISKEENKIYI